MSVAEALCLQPASYPVGASSRLRELLGLPEARYAVAESDAERSGFEDLRETAIEDDCPDRGGGDRYVGSCVVEECGRCGGKGRLPW